MDLPNDQGSIAALKWRRGSQPTSSNDKHLIGAVKAAGREEEEKDVEELEQRRLVCGRCVCPSVHHLVLMTSIRSEL